MCYYTFSLSKSNLFCISELELSLSMHDGEVNPRNRLVQMLHSGSPESVKKYVLEQFPDSSKCLCILIAKTVHGMGVNCKGVQWAIHFSPSKSTDECLGGYCNMYVYSPIANTEEKAQGRTISDEKFLSLNAQLNTLKKTIVTEGIGTQGSTIL